MGKKGTIAALAGGALAGAAIGMLFAPKSGKEIREDLIKKLDELSNKVKDISASDVKKYVNDSINELKKQIDDLSMEKVEKIAKRKAKDLERRVSELVKYVKEKGTPVLEEAVEQVRIKAIQVTENVLEKIEKDK